PELVDDYDHLRATEPRDIAQRGLEEQSGDPAPGIGVADPEALDRGRLPLQTELEHPGQLVLVVVDSQPYPAALDPRPRGPFIPASEEAGELRRVLHGRSTYPSTVETRPHDLVAHRQRLLSDRRV